MTVFNSVCIKLYDEYILKYTQCVYPVYKMSIAHWVLHHVLTTHVLEVYKTLPLLQFNKVKKNIIWYCLRKQHTGYDANISPWIVVE